MRKPLSSDGTKPVGIIVNKNPEIPEIIIRNTTHHLMRWFKYAKRTPYQLTMRSNVALNHWKNLKRPWAFSVGLCTRRIDAHIAGVSVNATKAEMTTDTAIVNANCRYNTPLMPLRKPTGTNTDASTQATPTTGPCTFCIAIMVASRGDLLLYLISYSTASITTIASSTSKPIANTMANNVSVLIEKLSTLKQANVPSRDTGTASSGINVERPLCRNKYTITATNSKASMKVIITSSIEAFTNFVLS